MAQNLSGLIWSVEELLRGDYKQSDYGKVILPITLLRRLEFVPESTKKAVLTVGTSAIKFHRIPHDLQNGSPQHQG